jgi:hypothetical protein
VHVTVERAIGLVACCSHAVTGCAISFFSSTSPAPDTPSRVQLKSRPSFGTDNNERARRQRRVQP